VSKAGKPKRAVKRQGPSTPLTRELIVSTALEIVDRDGVKALSMRKLGAELGVDPMAIYYHVPNKDALLDAIVEAVMSEIDCYDDIEAPAEDRIMLAANAYLSAMLAHANAMPIMLSRGPNTPAAARPVELLMGILRDAGLSPTQALAGMNATASAVRGAAAMVGAAGTDPPSPEELEALASLFPAVEFPHLIEAAMCPQDFARDFEFGVRALAKGLLLSCTEERT
jgi:AcrR family transcriptional regulator